MLDDMEMHLLGVSFRCATADVRQHLSFTRDEARDFLKAFTTKLPGTELSILSTCNRTEFYLVAHPGQPAVDLLHSELKSLRPDAPCLDDECKHYRLDGIAALEHLFRVACGLDSSVLGDVQISGQLRESLNNSRSAGASGRYLEHAVGQSLKLAARARTETEISAGSAGVAAAVVDMLAVRRDVESLCAAEVSDASPEVLLVGAGEIVGSVGRLLQKRQFGKLTFINRTNERAERLAQQCSGAAIPWERLPAAIGKADIILAATGAPQPILTRDVLAQAAAQLADGRRPLIVDAGMPPNVEAGNHSGFGVVGIDAIRERQHGALRRRHAAVHCVERLIEEELEAWKVWLCLQPTEIVIKTLYLEAAGFSESLADQLGDITLQYHVQKSLKQLLHRHVSRLRGLATSATVQGELTASPVIKKRKTLCEL